MPLKLADNYRIGYILKVATDSSTDLDVSQPTRPYIVRVATDSTTDTEVSQPRSYILRVATNSHTDIYIS